MFNSATLDPSTIDLKTLPWLPLEEKAAFPQQAAIYFAIDSNDTIQYIGRTINVRSRWNSHHRYDELKTIGGIKITYLFIDLPELLPQVEEALIEYFQPVLNYQLGKLEQVKKTRKNVPIALKLKTLRDNHPKKPSQRALGDVLGIAEANYRRLENGHAKSISFETVDKLCAFLIALLTTYWSSPNNMHIYLIHAQTTTRYKIGVTARTVEARTNQ